MYGFFGMTSTMISISPICDMRPVRFKGMLKYLDTSANRELLLVLKKDFQELIKFLEGLPVQYKGRDERIAYAKLVTKKYNSEEEKIKLEESLKGKEKALSPVLENSLNKKAKISDEAYKVINYLFNRLDKIKKLDSCIEISDVNHSDEMAFGQRLYLLKNRSKDQLTRLFSQIYKGNLNNSLLENLIKDLNLLTSKLELEDGGLENKEIADINFSDWKRTGTEFVNFLTIENINNVLELNLNEDGYFVLSKELYDLGLVGFSVYSKNFNDQFLEVISESYTTTTIKEGTDLYDFTLDLRETVDSLMSLAKDSGGDKE